MVVLFLYFDKDTFTFWMLAPDWTSMKEKIKTNQNNQIKRLLLYLLPIQSLAVGLPAINSLLSGFVVGHYFGTSALAALGFASPLTFLTSMLNGMLANGSQIKSGQELGRGNREGLSKIFNSTVALALCSGLFLTLVLTVLNRGTAVLLGTTEGLMEITRSYILGMAPSIALGVVFAVLLSFLQLDRAEKESTAAVAVQLIVNTAFNFLNVYVLRWGLFGIGLSVSLANFAAIAVSVPYFLRKSESFRFSIRGIDIPTLKSVMYIGLPSAITPACSFLRNRILNHFIFMLGGTPGMAAFTVANKISTAIGGTLESGYSGSSNLIASVLVGERDVESLRTLPKTMITAIFPIYVAIYALIFAFARPLAQLFGAEAAHMDLYCMAIRFYNLWLLTNAFKTPTLIIYRALTKVKFVILLYVVNILLIPALVAVLSPFFGLAFLFSFPWIAEIFMLFIYAIYYTVHRRKLPDSLFKLTDIPNTLAVPSADRCSAAIKCAQDAMEASEKMIAFCNAKKIPAKNAALYGLCVEELAMDTILHGFTRGKKGAYSIEMRSIYEKGEIVLMLRDNCPHFDPKEWLAMQEDLSDDRSLGLRLAAKSAKEINYSSALGLNVVTIKV